jgi:hypothetical protein
MTRCIKHGKSIIDEKNHCVGCKPEKKPVKKEV